MTATHTNASVRYQTRSIASSHSASTAGESTSWWVGLPPPEFYARVRAKEAELRETKFGRMSGAGSFGDPPRERVHRTPPTGDRTDA